MEEWFPDEERVLCYRGVWCGFSTHTQQLTAACNPCSMGSTTLLWPPQVRVCNIPLPNAHIEIELLKIKQAFIFF